MTESRPSLEIQIHSEEIRIYCSDYSYMEEVLNDYDSFIEFLGSNEREFYSFVNESQVEDLGSYLRSNEYPYALYRGEENLIDTWKAECDANGDGLTQLSAVDAELASELRSTGYVTLEDIRAAGYEEIAERTSISRIEAYDIWTGARNLIEFSE